MKKILSIGLWLGCLAAYAQPLLTEADAVAAALKNSPAVKAAGLIVRQNEQLVRSARNIPNPDLTFDSPSGQFYTVGVQQSFRFPTVYTYQNQLQSQQIGLAQQEQLITQNDLSFRVKSLYQSIQYAEAFRLQLAAQDSVYNQISRAAKRQFETGAIDKLALTFAEIQSAQVRNALAETTQQMAAQKAQLAVFTQVNAFAVSTLPVPIIDPSTAVPTNDLVQNPLVQAAQQIELISQKTIAVERANALPGFMVGYYNQGSKETNLGMRWRAGLSIPLWTGQYKSRIAAAQTGFEVAKQRTEAQKLALSADLQAAQGDLVRYRNSLAFYQNTALPQAEELISIARRFFDSGQTDYVGFLRTTNDAYQVKLRYLETLRAYQQTMLTINYLTGTL